jgi:hypothetical protein
MDGADDEDDDEKTDPLDSPRVVRRRRAGSFDASTESPSVARSPRRAGSIQTNGEARERPDSAMRRRSTISAGLTPLARRKVRKELTHLKSLRHLSSIGAQSHDEDYLLPERELEKVLREKRHASDQSNGGLPSSRSLSYVSLHDIANGVGSRLSSKTRNVSFSDLEDQFLQAESKQNALPRGSDSSPPPVSRQSSKSRVSFSLEGDADRVTPKSSNEDPSVWSGPVDPGTLIIFDWDDTLFPTTWLESARVNIALEKPPPQLEERMKRYHDAVVQLLEAATSLATVAIVTLARPMWVSQCCAAALPEAIPELITQRGVRVVYARNFVLPDVSERHPRSVYMAETNAAYMLEMLVTQKIAAMRAILRDHSPHQVIAIGDGDFECVAAHDLCLGDGEHGAQSSWLTKTVKLEPEPSVTEIQNSLNLLTENMGLILGHSDSFHMVLSHVGSSHASIESLIEDRRVSCVDRVLEARPESELLKHEYTEA